VYAWRTAGDAAVLALPSFANTAAAREQLRRLPEDYPAHARHPRLVFDLRGNGGGSLEWLRAWLAQAVRGPWRSYPWLEATRALWPCATWNHAVVLQVRDGRADAPAARAEREALRAAWGTEPPPPGPRFDPGLRHGGATAPYGGRVVALVDRYSGSSGELAALELRRALGAILVGERTAGTMQYGQLQRFVLPRTGLVWQVPTRRFFFDEEVEGVGLPVDVYLQRIDADAAALAPLLDRVGAHSVPSVSPPGAPEGPP
jgi:C-terminal processing protease CtpA/Prc